MPTLNKIIHKAINTDRWIKRIFLVFIDIFLITISLIMSAIVQGESQDLILTVDFLIALLAILTTTVFFLAFMGLYRTFIRHFSTEIVMTIIACIILSTSTLSIVRWFAFPSVSAFVPLVYGAFLLISITGSRFVLRAISQTNNMLNRKKLAIYGAGEAGAQTIRALKSNSNYLVRAVIDDNQTLHGRTMFGLPVISFEEARAQLVELEIETILLAIPSANTITRQMIISRLAELPVAVQSLPGISNLIDGTISFTRFKDIPIEELLGREPVSPDPALMRKNISDRVVMVTGAGGSIGSELCRQILAWAPQKLILLDVSEAAIYKISLELKEVASEAKVELIHLIGSIQNRQFIRQVLTTFKIHTIYHAAAYKHVPLMEQNISQCITNNVLGTMILCEESSAVGISDFILVSTDKAVNPTNFMGASKRMAELTCQMVHANQSNTCFSIVRFGNVLGSSGSVVPLFTEQIKKGGPLTVTHRDVTRYFMTIPEAAQLVIQAGSMARGGEVFVLDMGSPVKIFDLACKMAKLSGLSPVETKKGTDEGEIAVLVTGLRPGEKLFEELAHNGDLLKTVHPRIMRTQETLTSEEYLQSFIAKLNEAIENYDHVSLVETIRGFAPDVSSADNIEDMFFQQMRSAKQ